MLRCSYVFPDGRPCRCPARREHSICRHHTPQALEERARRTATPLPTPDTENPRSAYTSYWRGYHAVIRRSAESEFDDILGTIMGGLLRGFLSDRSGGRLLRVLALRRRQLHLERLQQQLIRLGEQSLAARKAGTSGRALYELLAPQVHDMMGLNRKDANA